MRAEFEQNKLSRLALKTTEIQNEIAFSCQAAPSVLSLCGCWVRAHRSISDSKNKQAHEIRLTRVIDSNEIIYLLDGNTDQTTDVSQPLVPRVHPR